MLPEMYIVKDHLAQEMDFDLLMAGLQIGPRRPMTTYEIRYLKRVWHEVQATTGQEICGELPADDQFIYHSEIPCRAVEALRSFLQAPPWDFFHRLQQAFYIEARNLNDIGELIDLAEAWGISGDSLMDAIGSAPIIEATRASFQRADQLAAHALPSVIFENEHGPRLVCGGYATADYLIDELRLRAQS